LTWVERNFGYAIAEAYAGHASRSAVAHGTSTAVYVKATLLEVATALAALTGEEHPLVRGMPLEAGKLGSAGTVLP
jgi:integrase/recombinase XerC